MRYLMSFILMSFLCLSAEAQVLVSADSAVGDTITVLLQDVSLAEAQLKQAIASPLPETRSARKERKRAIYVARTALAEAEQKFFKVQANHAPDLDTQQLFARKAWLAKREKDKYQAQVYAYTSVDRPTLQR